MQITNHNNQIDNFETLIIKYKQNNNLFTNNNNRIIKNELNINGEILDKIIDPYRALTKFNEHSNF
jgi:hypothetical protein